MISFVTIAFDDYSATSSLVLCNSLKLCGSDKTSSILISNGISSYIIKSLENSFDNVFYLYDFPDNLLLSNSDMSKLKIWLLTQFSKCVFIESDVLVLENIDDLFDRQEFSAVADPRWPDCFDCGVFVFEPNSDTYNSLIEYSIKNRVSTNFQCLLNMYFCTWATISIDHKIPFVYNCQPNVQFYTHSAALIQFSKKIKVARLGHFDMTCSNIARGDTTSGLFITPMTCVWDEIWFKWQKIFKEMVKPGLSQYQQTEFYPVRQNYELSSSSNESVYPHHKISEDIVEQQSENQDIKLYNVITDSKDEYFKVEKEILIEQPVKQEEPETQENQNDYDFQHRQKWERGEIDYLGEDKFDNILDILKISLQSAIVTADECEANKLLLESQIEQSKNPTEE